MSVRAVGISVLVPLSQIDTSTAEAVKSALRDLGQQMVPAYQVFVGGVTPKGDFHFNAEGPMEHALLGPCYVLSLAAPVETDDLPADCDAYVAWHGGAGGTVQVDPNAEGGPAVTITPGAPS